MIIDEGERVEVLESKQKKTIVRATSILQGTAMTPLENEELPPAWLRSLLRASFFIACPAHVGANRNECNLYCLDCEGDALCFSCLRNHINHQILQIRRSSYQNVVRVSEVSRFIDISGLQTYVINRDKVVFLNERPQTRFFKGITNACAVCFRGLLDANRYCSIGCKLRGMYRTEPLSSPVSEELPTPSKLGETEAAMGVDKHTEQSSNDRSFGSSGGTISPATPPIDCHLLSRRKGIPRRAPMH